MSSRWATDRSCTASTFVPGVAAVLAFAAVCAMAQPGPVAVPDDGNYFRLQIADGVELPVTTGDFLEAAETVFHDMGTRLGVPKEQFFAAVGLTQFEQQTSAEFRALLGGGKRIGLRLRPRESNDCPARGTAGALPGNPLISMYLGENATLTELLGILGHELGHLFQWYAISPGNGAGGLFDQGFASWAAGHYWTDRLEVPSLQAAVGNYIRSGTYVPLGETEAQPQLFFPGSGAASPEACLALRDVVYTEWAGFVEYLAAEFGRDRVYELVRAPPVAGAEAGPPGLDYVGTFGKSLTELEAAWLAGFAESE